MIKIIYVIIFSYFVLGGIGFYLINRKREPEVAKKSYTKFASYFLIIHIIFFSIIIQPEFFRFLTLGIIFCSIFELIRLRSFSYIKRNTFFVGSLVILISLSVGFFIFSGLHWKVLLFVFLILSIFDSFSQISGQLFGKKKIFPTISPNKTLGGLVGGAVIAIASSLLLGDLYEGVSFKTLAMAVGVVVFAFLGDLAASYYKRKYKVKDFSKLIPGHGGFLDRFDSLIAGGAWGAFYFYLLS
ncbi:phosphatidate cytidylyltransferase [Labilibaculum filiforme]|uniref:Phosphatidate cytidylyltransferase n=1 Tax=Labilibaculum filiforme TaxID=1940526 RepID=A0A2N3HTQ5_9BACT|nr:phosphatidate cytidylyltransferase [Labilibaculum filiforme]PKQ61432.1 phosphatidate cytidylyltransferase [Labilibaculum filiforme]